MTQGDEVRATQRRQLYWGPRVFFGELESIDPSARQLLIMSTYRSAAATLRVHAPGGPVDVRWERRRSSRRWWDLRITRDDCRVFITAPDGGLVLRAAGLFGYRIRRPDGTVIARRQMFRTQVLRTATDLERTICLVTARRIEHIHYLVWWGDYWAS